MPSKARKAAAQASYQQGQRKNIIYNGDMTICQRSTSVSGIGNGDAGYHVQDRWRVGEGGAPNAVVTMSKSTTAPDGFASSLKLDCTTASGTVADADLLVVSQLFEGQDLQSWNKGDAQARAITISFWVNTTKTGTYIISMYDNDNNRACGQSYTVSSSDTWEYKTVTFEGDTTGAFANDNGRSLDINLYFTAGSNFTSGTLNTTWNSYTAANQAVGQVHALASANDYVQWTGLQLEAGQTASDFEFLPVDVNRFRCYRYYYQYVGGAVNLPIGLGTYFSSSQVTGVLYPPNRPFRATPTLDIDTGTNYYYAVRNNGTASFDNFILDKTSPELLEIRNTSTSGNAGDAAFLRTNSASARMALDAEL